MEQLVIQPLLLDSWRFFKNHLAAFAWIILPIIIPVEILSALFISSTTDETISAQSLLWLRAIDFLVHPIYAGAIIFYIASVINGEPIKSQTAWKAALRFWLPYLILSLFVGVAVISGLFLFIAPGIFIAIRLAFAEFELLLNGNRPIDAIKNSWDATQPYMWTLLGGYLIITFFLFVPYYAVLLFNDSNSSPSFAGTISTLIYSILAVLYTIYSFRVYDLARNEQLKS